MLQEILHPFESELLWVLCVALVTAFLLAFSVGANDVSNSFGTSVGSRVLTVTQACILATIFEVAGSTLLGYSVCDTFRRNVYDVTQYEGAQKELMLGALACLMGSAIWNFVATAVKMPISGTHSIVGATIGFSVVLRGWGSIKWEKLLSIVASWFASPLLAGMLSSLIYVVISKKIIRKVDPLKNGLTALPLLYGLTIFINVVSVVIGGPKVLGLDSLAWYTGLAISLAIASAAIVGAAVFVVPRMREQILDEIISSASGRRQAPKPPQRTTSLTTTAYDNDAFRPDNDKDNPDVESSEDQDKQSSSEAATAKTAEGSTTADVKASSKSEQPDGQAAPEKPPVAPKPPRLERQLAIRDKFEDVDLSSASAPCGDAKTPQQQQQQQESVQVDKPQRPSKQFDGGFTCVQFGPSASPTGGGRGSKAVAKPGRIRGERFVVFRLFSSLQILTACFASFAHGTNDVSNAVAPLIPIWNIYTTGHEDIGKTTQLWILAFGGLGICTGLWAWGRAVMSTVGDGLTQLTPSKGFSVELGSAISVLIATKLGLPISTTHCKIGSLVIVGLVSSKFCSKDNMLEMTDDDRKDSQSQQAIDWRLFGHIALTWILTVPLAGATSALMMYFLKWLAL